MAGPLQVLWNKDQKNQWYLILLKGRISLSSSLQILKDYQAILGPIVAFKHFLWVNAVMKKGLKEKMEEFLVLSVSM